MNGKAKMCDADRLYAELPDLRQALEARQTIKAATMIRDWVSAKATYSDRELLIPHLKHSAPEVLELLEADVGGLWCGGAAYVLAYVLNSVNIRSCVYSYGAGSISHETVVFGQPVDAGRTYQYYVLDAYLNFHYVYSGTDTWMPISEIWR